MWISVKNGGAELGVILIRKIRKFNILQLLVLELCEIYVFVRLHKQDTEVKNLEKKEENAKKRRKKEIKQLLKINALIYFMQKKYLNMKYTK